MIEFVGVLSRRIDIEWELPLTACFDPVSTTSSPQQLDNGFLGLKLYFSYMAKDSDTLKPWRANGGNMSTPRQAKRGTVSGVSVSKSEQRRRAELRLASPP